MVCGVLPRSAQCFFDCGVDRARNVAKLGAEDSYRTAGGLPDGALGVAAFVSSRLRGTRRNSNSQDDTGRTRLRRFLPQSDWQSEEQGMEDRPNADNFTERTGEGRAGFPERSRPRIIDRRPTPVRTDARRCGRAARWLQGNSLVFSQGVGGLASCASAVRGAPCS